MSTVNSKDAYKNLLKKGFAPQSGDHKYLELRYNGKHILHTKVSHSNQDLGPDLIKAMAFQCKLSKSEFLDLAKCPMDKAQYLKLLKEKKLLD